LKMKVRANLGIRGNLAVLGAPCLAAF